MTERAENYLKLKPIAERFSRCASEITDDDIKLLIKDVMRERIADAINFDDINSVLQEWIDNHTDEIVHVMQDAIAQRLDLPRDYRWY